MRIFNLISVTIMTFVTVLFLGMAALADGLVTSPPSGDEFSAFVALISGVGGLGTTGIILVAVQGLMLVARQFLQGKYLLLIVSLLTLIGSGVGAMVSGGNILQGLLSGAGLAAMQVFISQIVIQFKKSPEPVISK